MTLPASGAISMSQVNTELGYSSTATISLNDAAVRTLAGVPSGAISLDNLHGKSNTFAFTISSNQTNANLRSLAVAAGWNQSSAVVATIAGGVYISSNSTGTPALTVNGSFPGGVSLTNNGVIVGMGGAGGYGANRDPISPNYDGGAGGAGGLALSVSSAISINNGSGTIAGGGGGGGGGGAYGNYDPKAGTVYSGGGGGGGGRSSAAANSAGGARGPSCYFGSSFGEGQNGGAGTVSGAGGGGLGWAYNTGSNKGGNGGSGGGWGSAGSGGGNSSAGSSTRPPGGAGAGGGAVSGNGNITWVSTGTRYGSIS